MADRSATLRSIRTAGPALATVLLAFLALNTSASTQEPSGTTAAPGSSFSRHSLAPDPSTVSTSGYCYYNYIWNGTRARVYHPSNGGCDQSVYSPLVIILHAAGTAPVYGYRDYDYLQQHLARNGFISASIDVLADSTQAADQQQAADEAWAFVESFLWSTWSKSVYINPQSIALIGHSRGGGTVRYLADKLAGDPVFAVKSVISLAPVGSDDQFVDGTRTVGYLTLYGTADGDVSPRGVYRHYDRAGNDDSQFDPAWRSDVVYKAMKLVHGAAHSGYSDVGSVPQQNLVKGYVLAFLKAHNANDITWYEDYIRGDAVPGGWAEPVLTQYSDGFYRRVIDHFDDGTVADSTLGGVVATNHVDAYVLDLDLALYASTYVHETRVLWMWASAEGASVKWSIPAGSRNASAFKWLSLRLGQAGSPPSNDLRIQIRNGLLWSPELRLADYGVIAQPTNMCFVQLGGPCSVQRHMATIRVPLAAFGPHEDVRDVQLRFRGDSIPKTFIVDNLEFSEFVLKP